MTDPARTGWPGLLWVATIALLPFGRSAELPMFAAAMLGVVAFWREPALRRDRHVQFAALLFLAYWLPGLLSAVDAVNPARSWGKVAADLRHLPMLAWFAWRLRGDGQWPRAVAVLAVVVAVWTLDALQQSVTGWSLGGRISADRLSGVFGAEDLKLGVVLAVLSPFPLVFLRRFGLGAVVVGALALGLAILLAGTRAAWLMYALVLAGLLGHWLQPHRALAVLLAAATLGVASGGAMYALYPPFADRVERSARLLQGDREGIDFALAGRLPIWSTSLAMIAAHPVNGVGIRDFRYAYGRYADAEDPWRDYNGPGEGAAHPHQWLLEVLAETGTLGLLCWLAGLGLALRHWRRCGGRHAAALPVALALAVLLFPLNTHYALYSSAWGGFLLALLAGWLGATAPPRAPQ